MSAARAPFGRTPEGRAVERFKLANGNGIEADLISYGAAVASLRVPDRRGQQADVVLGFDDLEGYLGSAHYCGAIVGRYANRIAGGRFSLDGRTYELAKNDGPNHLHGGRRGFDKVVWDAEPFDGPAGAGVAFSYSSRDGEEGYPGNLAAWVTCTLTDAGELIVDCRATTDAPTPVSLAQHNYYDLAGDDGTGDILDHELTIHADLFTPVDATLIPTGVLEAVDDTPFDFRRPAPIGAGIDGSHAQLAVGLGFDHNFAVRRSSEGLVQAARVVEPRSGRVLEVATTEPGLHFYSGNKLEGRGRGGREWGPRAGFCLEAQRYPDSPNRPSFPSAILRPGQEYRSRTVLTFSVVR
jgi:aldose 1-epimerase